MTGRIKAPRNPDTEAFPWLRRTFADAYIFVVYALLLFAR